MYEGITSADWVQAYFEKSCTDKYTFDSGREHYDSYH